MMTARSQPSTIASLFVLLAAFVGGYFLAKYNDGRTGDLLLPFNFSGQNDLNGYHPVKVIRHKIDFDSDDDSDDEEDEEDKDVTYVNPPEKARMGVKRRKIAKISVERNLDKTAKPGKRKLGFGKSFKKAGKSFKKAAKKAGKSVGKAAKSAGKAVANTGSNVGNTVVKTGSDVGNAVGGVTIGAYNALTNEVKKLKEKIKKLEKTIKEQAKEIADQYNMLKNKAQNQLNKLENTVMGPLNSIVNEAEDALNDITEIKNIAGKVADSTVAVIKQLDFLPSSGQELANLLGKYLVEFLSQSFCVPYECIAETLGVDIADVELYSSDRMSITTSLTPKTCLQVTSVEFDGSKLGAFLDLFKDLEALEDIYKAVRDFVAKTMEEIVALTDDVAKLVTNIEDQTHDVIKDIEDFAKDIASFGFRRDRRLSKQQITMNGEPASMETISAVAYQKGQEKFYELYGEHVQHVFRERKLAANAAKYIGLKSLKIAITADFGQTFTLEAEDRLGYSDSFFDESVSMDKSFPVPFTAGLMNIKASASMEAAMPYTMSMDASANAEFTYGMGEAVVTIDVVKGDFTTKKEPFYTELDVDASVGISGKMALEFAASASLGVCLGPTDDACLILKIDASQETAAGFDAIAAAGFEDLELTTLFTDELEYKSEEACGGNFAVEAGYWQYVKEPEVKISVTGGLSFLCMETGSVLYEVGGGLLQHSIDNSCLTGTDEEAVPELPEEPETPKLPEIQPADEEAVPELPEEPETYELPEIHPEETPQPAEKKEKKKDKNKAQVIGRTSSKFKKKNKKKSGGLK